MMNKDTELFGEDQAIKFKPLPIHHKPSKSYPIEYSDQTNPRRSINDKKFGSSSRNHSFSDVFAADIEPLKVEMDLEKELENIGKGNLHSMGPDSNIFNESSIHQEGKQEPFSSLEFRSNSDLKLNDIKINSPSINKRLCYLCFNNPELNKYITSSYTNRLDQKISSEDLIFPCLCNQRTHRECLKSLILIKKISKCDKCKAEYAINARTVKETASTNAEKKNAARLTILYILLLGGGIATDAILFSKDLNETSHLVIGFAILGLMILMTATYAFFLYTKFYSKKLADIDVFCKQTEIAYHSDNSQAIMQKFFKRSKKENVSKILSKADKMVAFFELKYFDGSAVKQISRPSKFSKEEKVDTELNIDHEDRLAKKEVLNTEEAPNSNTCNYRSANSKELNELNSIDSKLKLYRIRDNIVENATGTLEFSPRKISKMPTIQEDPNAVSVRITSVKHSFENVSVEFTKPGQGLPSITAREDFEAMDH